MSSGSRQGSQRVNRRSKSSRIAQAVQFEALEGRRMLNGDVTLPIAVLNAPEVIAGGATAHTFTVRYTDDVAMDSATVDGDEIKVGPSSFNPVVSLKNKLPQDDGSILATYEFTPPGGKWDSTDNSAAGYTVEILPDKVKDAAGNSVFAGVLGAIVVNIETSPPTAALKTSPLPNPTAGTVKYSFVVIYTDNVALDTTTFGGAAAALTISKTGFTADATYLSHVVGTAANSYEVTYEFTAPGGTWTADDTGSYSITKNPNRVKDVNGNALATSPALPALTVNIADADRPTATLDAPAFNATGNGAYQFTVLYNDNVGLNTATFGTGDVIVTRPGGYSQVASYVRFETGSGNERRVIYEIVPPGGTWDVADNGIYTVRVVADEVRDNTGNAVAVAVLDTFTVAIPPVDGTIPTMTLLAQNYEPLGSTLSVTVRYDDPQGINGSYLPSTRLLVAGPGGRISLLTYMGADDGVNPQQRLVTYLGLAPGGVWDPSDSGAYTVKADPDFAAIDTGNNPVDATASAGVFDVAIAVQTLSLDASGNLVVYGADSADLITLNIVNGMLRVAVGQTTQDFILPAVKTITIHGLAGDDSIAIGPGIMAANILGGDGNDTITGGDSADSIHGGNGDDSLAGGWGHDYLNGADGHDTLNGGADNDIVDGGLGNDLIGGGTGIDTVDYSWRTEALRIYINGAASSGQSNEFDNIQLDVENAVGGFGNDYIVGSRGANLLVGGPGNDTLIGGAGDDVLDGGLNADVMFGGLGKDTVTYASRRAKIIASINNAANDGEIGENDNILNDVENLIGGSGNDLLIGSTFANKLSGGAGNDTLKGGKGNDTLVGGPGIDRLEGGDGNDRFYMVDKRRDTAIGGRGIDTAEADSIDRRSEIEKLLNASR